MPIVSVQGSPWRRPDVLLEVDGSLLFEEDVNVTVEACSSGGEGGQVVTQLLPSMHCTAWYVPPTERIAFTDLCLAANTKSRNHDVKWVKLMMT